MRGGAGGGTDIEEHWCTVSAAEPSYCSAIFNKGGETEREVLKGQVFIDSTKLMFLFVFLFFVCFLNLQHVTIR